MPWSATMKLTQQLLLVMSISLLLAGCQTSATRQVNLEEYLQQFIGSSSSDIQKNLDFKALGYQTTKDVQSSDSALSYTILRPLSIPMAGSNATVGTNAMGAPVIRYDTTAIPTYDINFNCKVTFILKEGIAQSIQYLGKAC